MQILFEKSIKSLKYFGIFSCKYQLCQGSAVDTQCNFFELNFEHDFLSKDTSCMLDIFKNNMNIFLHRDKFEK